VDSNEVSASSSLPSGSFASEHFNGFKDSILSSLLSGSGPARVAAIGTILIPAMVKVDASVDFAVAMFIIAVASVFAWVLATSHFATDLSEKLLSITSNKTILLLLINGILLLAGCFIGAASAYYIFLPIMLPVI
jgi:TRAP-type C4-dicarboxylate transport system permease large subunit